MSLRYFSVRLYKNGRYILRTIYQRNIPVEAEISGKEVINSSPRPSSRFHVSRNVGYNIGSHARRLFQQTVLNKISVCLTNDVKKKVTQRLLSGNAGPLFAFIGVSVASGSGLLSKEDLLEGLCLEIRDTISAFHWNVVSLDKNEAIFAIEDVRLEHLSIGQPIGKGCSAVVYAAKLKDEFEKISNIEGEEVNVSDALSNYPLALKMLFNYDIQSNAMCILRAMYRETVPARRYFSNEEVAAWEASFPEKKVSLPPHPNIVAMYSVFADYVPQLAGGMKLYPASLPTRINPDGYGRNMTLFLLMKRYQFSLADFLEKNTLPPRDSVLLLAQLLEAVTHINMYGIAHRDLKSDNILVDNLFTEVDRSVPVLVVTDFGCCLADYVNGLHIPYNSDQIDKGGNVVLMAPEIATQRPGPFSELNYTKSDIWSVGTIAYEIFNMENPFSGKPEKDRVPLRNYSYNEEDLPPMASDVPLLIKRLILNMLTKNPNNRLSAEVAANVCQLYLWAPSDWLKKNEMPSSTEILKWLLCLTTKVFYEGRLKDNYMDSPTSSKPSEKVAESMTKKSRSTHPEYVLISSFLGRARLAQIKQALVWIQKG